ncbi:hypothetical protein [Pedobacter sandarakinus]|uniref:hypothetical protein n=1 Tax=Pedobacter sandarakinus TaxID=353156 RepID=UPI002246E624|nr:hypothetical protein [Pedobacter sandarakinus]MCX2574062.1 hypothetical protein [Pedobacter sandarakinus]
MPQDYQELVIATYKRKLTAGELSLSLSNPTTAKLKKECLKAYDQRYTPEDDDILSTFFNVDRIGNDFRNVISQSNTGAFRALLNHLSNDSIKTNERNSELLAWLIDFKPRPSFRYYQFLRNNQLNENDQSVEQRKAESSINNEEESGDRGIGSPTTSTCEVVNGGSNQGRFPGGKEDVGQVLSIENGTDSDKGGVDESSGDIKNTSAEIISKPDKPVKFKFIGQNLNIILSTVTLAIIAIGVLIFWQHQTDRERVTKDEKCMYWTGNKYEAISCNLETSTPKMALDIERLQNFKKITTPDKLTKLDLGKVWYSKVYGKIEFYTDSGMHPIDTNKALKPLTAYMLRSHVSYYRYLFNMGIIITVIIVSIGLIIPLSIKAFFKKNRR